MSRGSPTVDLEALTVFNGLAGRLRIALTEPAQPISPRLENLRAAPGAAIRGLSLSAEVYEPDTRELRPLTEGELDRVVFGEARVTLRSGREAVTFDAPDGRSFRVRDLLSAVVETERRARGGSEWFGGIDVHHVFFEGLERDPDGAWRISWGS